MQQFPRSKRLSIIGLFVALVIVLNLTLKIPAPYAGFLTYEIWEIPIVTAFLLFGFSIAIPVALLNFLTLSMFPGAILAGPLYNLIALLSMLAGVALAQRMRSSSNSRIVIPTVFGILSRVLVMIPVNAILLQFSPPLGFGLHFAAVATLLPAIALFNGTVALYTIPIALIVASKSSQRLSRMVLVAESTRSSS